MGRESSDRPPRFGVDGRAGDRAPVDPFTAMFRYPKQPPPVTWPAFALRRIVGALPGLLPLEFVCEGCEREQDPIGGGVERPLAVLEIKEDAPAAIDCFNAYAVSMASRRSRDSSDITST
jgi:hypothetical protein